MKMLSRSLSLGRLISLVFILVTTSAHSQEILLQGHAGAEKKPSPDVPEDANMTERREKMVIDQIEQRGISNPELLSALRRVPRHAFVPGELAIHAYRDSPLPIGLDQTISQPYIVALMTDTLQVKAGDRVLEIGAGSGYQAAILAELVEEVVTIEIVEPLARTAAERLKSLGYNNTTVIAGDGYKGWPDKAPFDAIMVTAAAPHIPQPLIDQLKPGGRMVIPVGEINALQHLILIEKDSEGNVSERKLLPVRFVPLTGER